MNEHVQAFLPKSETSWERDSKLEDLFEVGKEVELKVIELDLSKKRIILSAKQLTPNPWEVLVLNAGDEVKCTVTEIVEQGVRVNVQGAIGFLNKQSFGEKTEFAVGEEFTAKVRVFDAAKHRLTVTLREDAPRPAYNRRNNDNELNKYMKEDKQSNTLGDFINLDDYQ